MLQIGHSSYVVQAGDWGIIRGTREILVQRFQRVKARSVSSPNLKWITLSGLVSEARSNPILKPKQIGIGIC